MRIIDESPRGDGGDGKHEGEEVGKSSGNERVLQGAEKHVSKGCVRVLRGRGSGSSRKLKAIHPKQSEEQPIQVNCESAHNGTDTELRACYSVVPASANDSGGHDDRTNRKSTTTTSLPSTESHLKNSYLKEQ